MVNPYWSPGGIVSHIFNRIMKRNKNFIILCIGPTGSGKSYAMMRLAEAVTERTKREFNINNIVFKSADAVRQVTASAMGKGPLYKGSAIIFDEGGLDLSRKEWYQAGSKAMVQNLESQRFLNLLFIFTVPDESYIDKDVLPLVHLKIEMTDNIDEEKGLATGKPLLIYKNRYNSSSRTTPSYIAMFPIEITPEGIFTLTRIHFNKPSEKLMEEYEARKREFFIEHNKKNLLKIEDYEERKAPANYYLIADVKKEIFDNPFIYIKEFRDGTRQLLKEHIKLLPIRNVHRTYLELIKDPDIQTLLTSSNPMKAAKSD